MSWAGTLLNFSGDGVSWTGAGNGDTTPTFGLMGGKYSLTTSSSGTASATLQMKQPDGTFVSVTPAVGTQGTVVDLSPGTYQIVMGAAAATAAGALIRIPVRAT